MFGLIRILNSQYYSKLNERFQKEKNIFVVNLKFVR